MVKCRMDKNERGVAAIVAWWFVLAALARSPRPGTLNQQLPSGNGTGRLATGHVKLYLKLGYVITVREETATVDRLWMTKRMDATDNS
jgi:hypothetical protein